MGRNKLHLFLMPLLSCFSKTSMLHFVVQLLSNRRILVGTQVIQVSVANNFFQQRCRLLWQPRGHNNVTNLLNFLSRVTKFWQLLPGYFAACFFVVVYGIYKTAVMVKRCG